MVQISLGRVDAEYKAGDDMKSADDENKDANINTLQNYKCLNFF